MASLHVCNIVSRAIHIRRHIHPNQHQQCPKGPEEARSGGHIETKKRPNANCPLEGPRPVIEERYLVEHMRIHEKSVLLLRTIVQTGSLSYMFAERLKMRERSERNFLVYIYLFIRTGFLVCLPFVRISFTGRFPRFVLKWSKLRVLDMIHSFPCVGGAPESCTG